MKTNKTKRRMKTTERLIHMTACLAVNNDDVGLLIVYIGNIHRCLGWNKLKVYNTQHNNF